MELFEYANSRQQGPAILFRRVSNCVYRNRFISSQFRYVEAPEKFMIDNLLGSLFDVPLYHTFSWKEEHFDLIADIIKSEAKRLLK